MGQKLSAMTYIKNNKRKVSVLVISMAMCLALFYLTQFLLTVSVETFRVFLVEQAKTVQYFRLPASAFDVDFSQMSEEEAYEKLALGHEELVARLEEVEGVKKAYYTDIGRATVSAVIGQYQVTFPFLPESEIDEYMEHCGVELIEGTLPKEENDIILSENILKNISLKLGDEISGMKIVGVTDDNYYFGCGVREQATLGNQWICVLMDGSIEDLSAVVRQLGYEYDEKDAYFDDVKNGEHNLKMDVVDAIEFSMNLIYIGIVCVVSILVLIVYVSYMRDRRNEWCLYSSIGFSRKEIYAAIMRELLFTFVVALAGAVVISVVGMLALDALMIDAQGLKCRYWHADTVLECMTVLVVVMGLLQIPIRYALYKIRTIDAMDDELNA